MDTNLLTNWVFCHLVNRTDVWGGHWKRNGLIERITCPRIFERGRAVLTPGKVHRHFEYGNVLFLIGLHAISVANDCRWVAVDVDNHGDADPQVNLKAASGWFEKLIHMGIQPLLFDSNGAGGFHLYVIFRTPVISIKAFRFAKYLVSDFKKYGLGCAPETFPAQPKISQTTPYGAWLRLFGRHHKRQHDSHVWTGNDWQPWYAATNFITNTALNDPTLIPVLPADPPPPPAAPAVTPTRDVLERAKHFMAKTRNRKDGGGRNDTAFGAARFLIHGLGIGEEMTFELVAAWNTKNEPPLDEAVLRQVVENAGKYPGSVESAINKPSKSMAVFQRIIANAKGAQHG